MEKTKGLTDYSFCSQTLSDRLSRKAKPGELQHNTTNAKYKIQQILKQIKDYKEHTWQEKAEHITKYRIQNTTNTTNTKYSKYKRLCNITFVLKRFQTDFPKELASLETTLVSKL